MGNVFISYSWDNKDWVLSLRNRLEQDGVKTVIDRTDMQLGDSISVFMEQSIKAAEVILLILTPEYKRKADNRLGGVGYEGSIITGEILCGQRKRQFIPVLAMGEWNSSLPIWVMDRNGVNLSARPYSEMEYERLLETLPKHDIKVSRNSDLLSSLSGKQLELIFYIHGTSGKTISELSEKTGMTKASIRYQLTGLLPQGIIRQNSIYSLSNSLLYSSGCT